MSPTWIRIGGACGLVGAVAMIPAYLVGTPDAPRTPEDVAEYYEDSSAFVTANGTVPILHLLGTLVFLAVLVAMLRRADRTDDPVLHRATLAGGVTFVALTAAGFAAEVAYPHMLTRFDAPPDESLGQLMLSLATWLYHFCQLGAAVMVAAVSLAALRDRVLPVWMAALGLPVVVLTLLHTWIPLVAALSSLVWIGLVSLLMLAGQTMRGAPGASSASRP